MGKNKTETIHQEWLKIKNKGIRLNYTAILLMSLGDPNIIPVFKIGVKIDNLSGKFFWSSLHKSHKRYERFIYV